MKYAMLLQILEVSESQRDDESLPDDIRHRSAEAVSLLKDCMNREGLTRTGLQQLAAC